MYLSRFINYYFDGYWYGYDKSIIFYPEWKGYFGTQYIQDSLMTGEIDTLIFKQGVKHTPFHKDHKYIFKYIKNVTFYTHKSEHYYRKMFIPHNIQEINIYYKGEIPNYFDFELDNIETKINYNLLNQYQYDSEDDFYSRWFERYSGSMDN